jgi:hypothetical protein
MLININQIVQNKTVQIHCFKTKQWVFWPLEMAKRISKINLICCAIEEETKMVFCVLGKLRRCGDYGGDPFEIRSGGKGNCAVR